MKRCAVSVVGMGDHGCLGLSALAIGRIIEARVLIGKSRHLAYFPQFTRQKIVIGKDIPQLVDDIGRLSAEYDVCVLASHDPLFYGIGSRIIDSLGAERVEIIPYPSAMQFAFAAIKERWDDAIAISLHGRPLVGLVSRLKGAHKAVILTDNTNTPQRIAGHLIAYGLKDVTCYLCEDLAGPEQKIRALTPAQLADLPRCADLNLLVIKRDPQQDAGPLAYRSDEAYLAESFGAGLITKREARALALAAMRLRRDMVVWDIGAGSGAVAIEAAEIATHGVVYAIEREPARMALVRANAMSCHADNVVFVEGEAPQALAGLPQPEAVFVGGSGSASDAVLDACYRALKEGGIMVVSAITFDKITQTLAFCRSIGIVPEVTLVQCARSAPLADHLRYQALNPIHLVAIIKPGRGKA